MVDCTCMRSDVSSEVCGFTYLGIGDCELGCVPCGNIM
jgi:hypothetical protein